jgi:hypothetical protein
MAESGGISGLLGSDGEAPGEGSSSETSTPLDPTAAALAAEAARSTPELAEKVSAYFVRQSRLVEIQTEHLHEQRAVNLQLLKLKRFDERLRVALRLFVILGATVIGIGALIMIRDAIVDHGLVVEAFSVPPDLVRDGLTGEVVANRFLDKLQAMQAATQSDRPSNSYQYNWGSDIKVEIPETGLDLNTLSKYFRDRFGHANRITGEVIARPPESPSLPDLAMCRQPPLRAPSVTSTNSRARRPKPYIRPVNLIASRSICVITAAMMRP